ncbi:inter-alpha-trypsin inhibitor heavy chain H6 isoform X2 [Clupea harengus]|uniref:Inter-alpha-trypsin inhibitor heavy chain H6 isoform X2 n=1 Tax=Clupea harengus TaxID=7950 RepID=A0A6P8FHQ8_CLUHA|nr:inter-alpha-trypsin inhibitor heavy chain H6 isoform X2 [Clupea harengus]
MGLVWEVAVTSLCVLLACVHLVELRAGATRDVRSTQPQLEVTDFHVKSTVVSRYARTTVISTVFNRLPQATDATFEVDLPSTAFISNFTITSGGKEYVSQVKQKQAAKQIYDEAKKKGKTAGLVESRKEVPGKFSIDVSVAPGERLSFKLSFEQLLVRRLGRYELALGLRPTQPVPNLTVEVSITERTGISFVRVLPLRTGQHLSNTLGETGSPSSTLVEQWSQQRAQVLYSPTLEQQTSSSPKGLDADFVIEYDVILTDLIGDVQVYDGYFVHYFAPRELPVVPKEVIFVIDVSGSMAGGKLEQTKEAMDAILGDLRSHDHFNIITFSSSVHPWKHNATVPATADNIRQARAFAKKIQVRGSTDINAALVKAGTLLRNSSSQWGVRGVPMVIFLTDGAANHGVTHRETMRGNVREALGSAALFGLAFGRDADYDLLRQLSLENRGVARRVYSDSKANLQLKGFYDEVANPLLSDVQLSYSDDQAFDVTRSLFPNYFQGSELVVAGRVHPGARDLGVTLNAFDTKKHLTVENNIPLSGESSPDQEEISGFVRRLWAYFTIKELLLTAENASDPSTRALLEQNATRLSLKYNFVTPVTSLVVVKPDLEEVPTEEKPSPDPTDKKAKNIPQRGHSRKAFASSADGDPHFQVHLPKLEKNLCFTIDGHASDVLRLLEDAENGITVDGRLMWAPPEVGHEDQERTYFDQIVVSRGGPEAVVVTLTLDSVNISQPGRPDRTLLTGAVGSVRGPDLQVSIDEQFRCWVELGQGVSFLVLFHHYQHPDYMQLDHLGFYIAKGDGLSVGTQGLLGQFQHADIKITEETGGLGTGLRHRGHRRDSATDASTLTFGMLQRGTAQVPVTLRRKMMKDTVRKRHTGLCWEVGKDDVEKILAKPYRAYIRDTDVLSHHSTN